MRCYIGGGMNIRSEDPARQLAGFIAKFEPKLQTLIRSVRRRLRRKFPAAHELVYDNYNFFVIAYGPTERPSECTFSVAAAANGVGLCFLHGASLPDPKRILSGAGKQTRFLRLESAAVLDRPEVEALFKAALVAVKAPMPMTGRGKLIIRSISAKQRPRRRKPEPGAKRQRGGAA
jgi:hypothetical protein